MNDSMQKDKRDILASVCVVLKNWFLNQKHDVLNAQVFGIVQF